MSLFKFIIIAINTLKCASSEYYDYNNFDIPDITAENRFLNNSEIDFEIFFQECILNDPILSDKNILDQCYDTNKNSTNANQFDNFFQNVADAENRLINNSFQTVNSFCQSNDCNIMDTNNNFNLDNSKSDLHNDINQLQGHTVYLNTCRIEEIFPHKLIVSQAHIDYMEAIIEDISAECARLSDYELQKDLLFYFSSECIKFLEEIKKFNLQNQENFKTFTDKSKTDKFKIFTKNSKLSEETRLFLDLLSSMNPEESRDSSQSKYYQILFSHIDVRVHKLNYAPNDLYQNTAIPVERLNQDTKKRNISENEEVCGLEDDPADVKKIKTLKKFVFRRVLFSKKFFYILYFLRPKCSTILVRYKYKNDCASSNFSFEDLDLNSKKIIQLSSRFQSIFLDSKGTLYVHRICKSRSRKCLQSRITKVDEEIFEYNPKIENDQDLSLSNIVIDKFIVYLDKIYLLTIKNKRMLVYTTDFRVQNIIEFKTDRKIVDNAETLLLVIQGHVVIIVDFMAFIWKIDSKSKIFEEIKCSSINKMNSFEVMYSKENKFICRNNYSMALWICEIENIENSPSLKLQFLGDLPQVIGKKRCEIFRFIDNEVYCAFFHDEDADVEKIFKIIKFDALQIKNKFV